jgi:hypothetical protein
MTYYSSVREKGDWVAWGFYEQAPTSIFTFLEQTVRNETVLRMCGVVKLWAKGKQHLALVLCSNPELARDYTYCLFWWNEDHRSSIDGMSLPGCRNNAQAFYAIGMCEHKEPIKHVYEGAAFDDNIVIWYRWTTEKELNNRG